MLDVVVTPNDLGLLMQKVPGKWWRLKELQARTKHSDKLLIYMLQKLMDSHLLERRIGERTRTTFYRIKMHISN